MFHSFYWNVVDRKVFEMKRKNYPSREYLHECLRYENGKLFWRVRPRHHFKSEKDMKIWNIRYSNKEAGCLALMGPKNKKEHRWVLNINSSLYRRSSIVWLLHSDKDFKSEEELDHKNNNQLDDDIENLRLATRIDNVRNRKKTSNNKSGYKGVFIRKDTGAICARIGLHGKSIYLGQFENIEDAHKAYMKAAQELYGEFANVG